ncbi:hypothetical protein [Paenibacillus sp. sgz500958]|uniref:hypothetical protein n=1 Tax=Paenibacillus sp. sgz500958 TaxID=3242475 RepID=UPI0036D3D9B6
MAPECYQFDQDIAISMYGSKAAYDDVYQKSLQAVLGLTESLKSSGNLYTIKESDHMMFEVHPLE